MQNFIIYIGKYLGKSKFESKKLKIKALDLKQARESVYSNYPDWEINMFWYEWKERV